MFSIQICNYNYLTVTLFAKFLGLSIGSFKLRRRIKMKTNTILIIAVLVTTVGLSVNCFATSGSAIEVRFTIDLNFLPVTAMLCISFRFSKLINTDLGLPWWGRYLVLVIWMLPLIHNSQTAETVEAPMQIPNDCDLVLFKIFLSGLKGNLV